MAETTSATTSKGKPKPVAIGATGSELPKFEMPRFEMPKFEIPTAFREFAEKGIAQARENYEKAKTAAEEATDVFEDTYSTATKGCASYGLKVIETTRANSDAAFDLMSDVMNAKSYSEVVELYSAFLRKQFDTLVTQAKELSEHAQKVATETAEPIKGATLIGDGPTVLTRVKGIGNDLALDEGIGVCGKGGQSVPAGVGQPTLLIDGLTVGGTAA